jgi:hypothetical protein
MEAFWKAHPAGDEAAATPAPALLYIPIISLAAMTVFIGLNAGPFVDAALDSAEQVLNPQAYIAAVTAASEAAAEALDLGPQEAIPTLVEPIEAPTAPEEQIDDATEGGAE